MEKLISDINSNLNISSLTFKYCSYAGIRSIVNNGKDLIISLDDPSFFEKKSQEKFKENLMKCKKVQCLALEIDTNSLLINYIVSLVQIISLIPSINSFIFQINSGTYKLEYEIIKNTFSYLSHYPNLKRCSIKFGLYQIDEEGAKELGLGISQIQTLSSLTFEMNRECIFALKSLGDMNNLTSLSIKVTPLNQIAEKGAFELASTISRCQNLTSLFLRIEESNMIRAEGATYIGKAIGSLKKLFQLNLVISSTNQLTEEGAAGLAMAFQNGQALHSLSLEIGNNHIGPKGVTALAEGISKCINMVTLHILLGSGNEVGIEGCKGLAEGISYLKKLTYLGITIHRSNGIGDDGTIFLGKGISKLPNLTKAFIGLKGNNVSRNGAIGLKNSLKESKRLNSLIVSINKDFETIFLKIPRIINLQNS